VTGGEPALVEPVPNIVSVEFSRLGDCVGISCDQGYVRLLKTDSWRDGGLLAGFLHSAAGLSFSKDGQRLAVGSAGEEAIRVYELERHQPLVTFAAQGGGFSPGFDSSDNILAGMNNGGQLLVWSAPSWQEIEEKEKRASR
jgi:WD40 repeat protein